MLVHALERMGIRPHIFSTFFTINSDDNGVSGNTLTFEATFMDEIDINFVNPSSRVDNIIRDIDALGMTYTFPNE